MRSSEHVRVVRLGLRNVEGPPRPIRLVCFPHAGGGSWTFASWHRWLSSQVELWCVESPGPGAAFALPEGDLWPSLVTRLADALEPSATQFGYALFGHSLGALLAFEVARELRRRAAPDALALVVSGHGAPHTERLYQGPVIHRMSDTDLLGAVAAFGGLDAQLAQNARLLPALVPLLRHDFRVLETYRHRIMDPLSVPLLALGGSDDPLVDGHALDLWRVHTSALFGTQIFRGDHFYLNGAGQELARGLSLLMERLRRGQPAVSGMAIPA